MARKRFTAKQIIIKLREAEVESAKGVLLTYNSDTIASYSEVSNAFIKAFIEETSKHYETFASKNPVKNIRVHLFLFPVGHKQRLLAEFDRTLKACQGII